MNTKVVAFVMTWGATLVASCSDSAQPSSNEPPSKVETQATDLMAAVCEHLEMCAPGQGRLFTDAADCHARLPQLLDPSCAPLAYINSPAELDACIGAIKAAACGSESPLTETLDRLLPCRNLRLASAGPAAALGEGCFGRDCPADATCELAEAGAASCLRCQPASDVYGDCVTYPHVCKQGLYCDVELGSCAVPKATGQSCELDEECESHWCDQTLLACRSAITRDLPCVEGEHCVGALACRDGRCTDRGLEGERCGVLDCEFDLCVGNHDECLAGYVCVVPPLADEGQCRLAVTCASGELSAPCLGNSGCASGFCETDVMFECLDTGAQGETCFRSYECDAGLICNQQSHACELPGGTGGVCFSLADCQQGLACVAGECGPRLSRGDSCPDDPSCISGYCAGAPFDGTCAEAPVCTP